MARRRRRQAPRALTSSRAPTNGPSAFDPTLIHALLERFFRCLYRPIRHNLALLIDAFLTLTATLRSGHGELTLASVARALPLPSSFRVRYKRLNRFLDNPLFDPQGLTEGLLVTLIGSVAAQMTLPVLLDQSAIGAAQILLAGIPFAGRVLPLSLMTFTYADIQNRPAREKSQNFVEKLFFLRLLTATPTSVTLCFILDRGYARVSLLRELLAQPRATFVLRTRRDVVIERFKRGRWVRCAIGSLRARNGKPCRFARIRYRGKRPIEVDLIIYYEHGHKEPWYLLVPPDSQAEFPAEHVVTLYRRRMQIEQGFRDFKTHLGIRGLRLEVRISERIQRLLMGFTLAYALVVSLGVTRLCEQARDRLEDRRRVERHGTERILSARTVAALLLAGVCREILHRLRTLVHRLLRGVLQGRGLYRLVLRL